MAACDKTTCGFKCVKFAQNVFLIDIRLLFGRYFGDVFTSVVGPGHAAPPGSKGPTHQMGEAQVEGVCL